MYIAKIPKSNLKLLIFRAISPWNFFLDLLALWTGVWPSAFSCYLMNSHNCHYYLKQIQMHQKYKQYISIYLFLLQEKKDFISWKCKIQYVSALSKYVCLFLKRCIFLLKNCGLGCCWHWRFFVQKSLFY